MVGGVDADAHDVSKMICELSHLRASLYIPLHAGHVTRRGEDTPVVDEAAAGKVAGMARELSSNTCRTVAVRVEVVNGADVIETTASDVVSAGGIGTGHDP